jgi:AcrR family transcriptional regulator
MDSFADWLKLVDNAIEGPREGWAQVERMLRAAFVFFEEHPEFVRLVRWEALEGGPILREELAVLLRPLFDRGADFLEREMDAGRLRRYDARQLLLTGYGAVLAYLSDAHLMTGLLDIDPLSHEALAARREHVIDVLRTAVVPDSAR